MESLLRDDVVPRSVGRVLDALEVVLTAGSCNLTAVATAAGLTPTTALRHLRALEARGYLRRDGNGLFSAGPTLVRIAASLGRTDPLGRLIAAAQPHLDRLAGVTGESAYLAISDGKTATYVATAESVRAIRHVGWVGQTVPLRGTAVGAALAKPGVCATKTGAIEPDITAISRAQHVPDHLRVHNMAGVVGVALSVIGPQHRLRVGERRRVEAALETAAAALAGAIGRAEAVA